MQNNYKTLTAGPTRCTLGTALHETKELTDPARFAIIAASLLDAVQRKQPSSNGKLPRIGLDPGAGLFCGNMGFKIITRSSVKHRKRRSDWSWNEAIGGCQKSPHRRRKRVRSNKPNHKAWCLVKNTDTSRHAALPYPDYLRTPYWRAIRKIKLFAAGRKCENCSAVRRLQVHHLTYSHRGREHEALETLRVLCRACHEGAHNIAPAQT